MAKKQSLPHSRGKAPGYQVRWQRYELLKATHTRGALIPGEFAEACHRAAQQAGV